MGNDERDHTQHTSTQAHKPGSQEETSLFHTSQEERGTQLNKTTYVRPKINGSKFDPYSAVKSS